VHAEDRDLGEVDDGRREQAADVAGVGDREGAAGEVLDGDLAIARARGEVLQVPASSPIDLRSTSLITGTMRPLSVSVAMPKL
jgi:hypothetical protein